MCRNKTEEGRRQQSKTGKEKMEFKVLKGVITGENSLFLVQRCSVGCRER